MTLLKWSKWRRVERKMKRYLAPKFMATALASLTDVFKKRHLVRICKHKRAVFDKVFSPNWTKEVYIASAVVHSNPITSKQKDLKGEPLKGSFYELELPKADQAVFEFRRSLERQPTQLMLSGKRISINLIVGSRFTIWKISYNSHRLMCLHTSRRYTFYHDND